MDTNNPTKNVPTPAAGPSPAHHANLKLFLTILLGLGPAIAAPFIPPGRAKEIFDAELPIAQAASAALASQSE